MKKRILVVDDQRDVAMLLQHQLERQYEIEVVHSGAEALKRVFRDPYDLVLMDFDMKDIKGDRICLMMHSDDKIKNVPVIIITAHVEVDERIFKEYGASAVIYKPVAAEDLLKIIHACLKES